MGPITFSADIQKPHLWPLETLLESEDLLLQRILHVNTKAANWGDAVRRLLLVAEAIEQKRPAKQKLKKPR